MIISDSLYHQLVWDYQLSPHEFQAILTGEFSQSGLDQHWAMARVLENAPYYQALKLIPLDSLQQHWPALRNKIHRQDIKKGYDFVLHQYALSTSK